MARFDNKVVLVSGGARGQGAAEARLLVAQGAKVVIGDVLDNQGQALAVELGPAAAFVRHDVTSVSGGENPRIDGAGRSILASGRDHADPVVGMTVAR
jgi:NAD(P)-dependent dehydrogenase (short-subunit alcohol dehydrogenase family)